MSKEKRREPKLRFPGFTEDWEQRKFLDLLDTQNGIRRGPFGSSLKKDSFVKKSDYVVYEQQNAIYDNYVTRYFISKEKYNELIRFNIQPGDFIMSGAGTIGRISMVPDGIKKGVFNQALIRFKVDKNSVNPLYFLKFMQSDMMQKQLTQANPGSAMTNLVPMDELKKWDVTIPSLEEQNKISNFINQIDESITLHQCKLKKLNLAKKSLLQKLFPRNGSQIPGVRFKGFTDAWEQRKLGDIATFSKGNGYSKSDLAPSGDPIILYGRLYTNYETTIRNVDTFVELKDKSVISQGDEVIVPASGETVEDISRASVVKDQGVIIGGDLNVIKVNHLLDPTFLALTISNGEQQKELSKRAQGKSVVHLHNSDLQEVNLTFPLLNEQKEISTLFEKMDSIITLHQRKLERLQEVKKGLLQKMFV